MGVSMLLASMLLMTSVMMIKREITVVMTTVFKFWNLSMLPYPFLEYKNYFFLHSQTSSMENVNDEILSEMMVEHLSVPNEFFSLPPLYPEVEDALWEDPDKIIYVCIY